MLTVKKLKKKVKKKLKISTYKLMGKIVKVIKRLSTSYLSKSYVETTVQSSFKNKIGKEQSKICKIMAKIEVNLSINREFKKIFRPATLINT